MTGVATVEVGGESGLRLTIKGVNHRFLDLSFRLPAGMDALEMRLRRELKERLRRGHVDLTLSTERRADTIPVLNELVLSAYVTALRGAGRRHGIGGEPEWTALLRLPGVFSSEVPGGTAIGAELEPWILAALERLLELFDRVRAEEGTALAAGLRGSLARIEALSMEARVLRAEVRDAHVTRLRVRMTELLEGAAEVSEARLLTEAALLAERSDVDEELVRLETHVASFRAGLDAGGELGKRLDFLSQEMNREANTVLSKTGSAAGRDGLRLTEIGLECKAEIERIREQVQNIE